MDYRRDNRCCQPVSLSPGLNEAATTVVVAADPIATATGGLGLRRGGPANAPAASSSPAPAAADLPSDYLDIPAFLRRQAD